MDTRFLFVFIFLCTEQGLSLLFFVMNGHGVAPAVQTINEGEKATKPANPTASGYTFDGWHVNKAFSKAFDFENAITADTTIYAKWTKNSTTPTDPTNSNDSTNPIGPTNPVNSDDSANPTSPQTGNDDKMMLWIVLLFICGGALVEIKAYSKKYKYATRLCHNSIAVFLYV